MTVFVDPCLALQAALGTRLATSPAITNLVPEDNIRADWARPEACPSILLGDSYTIDASKELAAQRHVTAITNIHVWTQETGKAAAGSIMGAIFSKLINSRPQFSSSTPFRCVSSKFSGQRFIPDPDKRYVHGILTFEYLIELPAWNANGSGDWEDDTNWLLL